MKVRTRIAAGSDWVWAGSLLLLALALRVPCTYPYGYYWDGMQFALAIEEFDMRVGVPHPPGFFLYVMLGRLLNLLIGEPYTTLVWINIVGGSLLAAATYWLGRNLFGNRCGVFAGLVMASSPLTWFYSEFALTTILDGLLAVALALVCWRAIETGGQWRQVVAMAVLLGVMGGVRGQTVPGMLPLWLYTFWRMREGRWRKLGVAIVLVGAVGLAWFVPLVKDTGGLAVYWDLLRTKSIADAPFRLVGGGFDAVAENVAAIVVGLFAGLLLAGILAVIQGVLSMRRPAAFASKAQTKPQLQFLAWWIVPQMLFGSVVMYTYMPGYMLSYFAAVAVLAGLGVAEFTEQTRKPAWVVGLAIVAVNVWFYFTGPTLVGWSPRVVLGAPELRQQSRQLAGWFDTIRQRYRPGEVEIWHATQSLTHGIRHFQYYLREYENCLLIVDPGLAPPYNRRYWRARNGRVEFEEQRPQVGSKTVVLVVPPGEKLERFAPYCDLGRVVEVAVPGGMSLYEVAPGR